MNSSARSVRWLRFAMGLVYKLTKIMTQLLSRVSETDPCPECGFGLRRCCPREFVAAKMISEGFSSVLYSRIFAERNEGR